MELIPVVSTILLDAMVVYVSLVVKRRTSERFWSFVYRIFWPFYRYIKPGHSGILGTYFLWMIAGFIALFLATTVVLR